MKVNNVNGTSDNTCKCRSWLDHWKNFGGGAVPSYCPEQKCTQTPEVGAHVQKDSPTDRAWYVIPLCKKHSGKTGESLEVSDNIVLVSANVSQTCGTKWLRIGGDVTGDYEFTPDEVERAFELAGGRCECCGKLVSWGRSRADPGRGQWEAHHGSRSSPVVLCTGEPENCHLNCGHAGDYHNPGVTPRVRREQR